MEINNYLIGKEDRLEIISKILQGEDVCVEEKYNSDVLTLKGTYHKLVTKDFEKMEKLYKMAIELGNSSAMNNFAEYFYNE